MTIENDKTILYRQEDGAWVAEIPAISGCYALMPSREAALAELAEVLKMIATEYREKDLPLPALSGKPSGEHQAAFGGGDRSA